MAVALDCAQPVVYAPNLCAFAGGWMHVRAAPACPVGGREVRWGRRHGVWMALVDTRAREVECDRWDVNVRLGSRWHVHYWCWRRERWVHSRKACKSLFASFLYY
jgi:hypothetical protein